MFFHPDVVLAQAHDRHRRLIAEADAERLLTAARLARRAARRRKAAREPMPQVKPVARGRPGDNLAPCETPGTAPAH